MKTLLGYLDVLSDFYGAPPAAARALRQDPPIGLGVLCFLVSGSAWLVAQSLAGGGSRFLFRYLPWPAVLSAAGLMPLVTGFLLAGIYHLTAEMLGARRGSAAATFVLLGLCQLVYILYLPVVLTSEVFFEHPAAWRWGAMALLFLTSLALQISSFAANYEVEAGRVVAVLALPYLAALALAVGLVAATVGSLVSMVKMFQ